MHKQHLNLMDSSTLNSAYLSIYTQTVFLSCHRLCSYVEVHLLSRNLSLATLLWFHLFFYFISLFFFFLMRNIIIAYNISQKIPCGKFYLSPNTHKKKGIVNWNGMQLNPGICISLLLFFHIHIHVSRSSLGHDLD